MQAQSPGITGLRPQYLLSKLLLVYGAQFISELVSHRLHPHFLCHRQFGMEKSIAEPTVVLQQNGRTIDTVNLGYI